MTMTITKDSANTPLGVGLDDDNVDNNYDDIGVNNDENHQGQCRQDWVQLMT